MTKLLCVLWAVALLSPLAVASDDDLAVVVNKNNPVANVTKAQLNKILLGEQSAWSAGKKVNVVLRAPGQPEREGVLRSISGMSEDEYNQHWMKAAFNGSTASTPKALATGEAVRSLVAILPGAIGFLKLADVNDSVKAITVDGVAAGDPDYKIKSGK